MFSRINHAAGLALFLALLVSVTVFAKGGFSFIAITGPGLDEEIRATDLKLTEDFFAFADFSRDKANPPKDPGEGYEITRYYIDGKREIPFDQLHYYPETGFVFYDGIVNGESEYDGEWYSANPDIRPLFAIVLPSGTITKAEPVQPAENVQPVLSVDQTQPVSSPTPSQLVMPIVITAGLVVLILFAVRLRKPSIQ